MKTAGWMLLPMLLLGSGSANAREVYCDMKGGALPDGVERTRDWHVVASTARKPQLPGQTKATTSCSIVYSSLGGSTRPIEIITKPKIGQAKTTVNKLYYRSAKSGEDLVTVRFHKLGRTGQPETTIIHYRIHVVDKPL